MSRTAGQIAEAWNASFQFGFGTLGFDTRLLAFETETIFASRRRHHGRAVGVQSSGVHATWWGLSPLPPHRKDFSLMGKVMKHRIKNCSATYRAYLCRSWPDVSPISCANLRALSKPQPGRCNLFAGGDSHWFRWGWLYQTEGDQHSMRATIYSFQTRSWNGDKERWHFDNLQHKMEPAGLLLELAA